MDHALHQLDEMMPEEPGPDWTCAECGESFQSERCFKLHEKRSHDEQDIFV